MPITRFHCVHCGAPLKTSAELTADKRILCPKCETIFPVPAHLLTPTVSPGGTMPAGPDLTSGVGAESPRVKLVGMEEVLGPEPARPQGPESAAAASPPQARPSPSVEPEPWEEELRQTTPPVQPEEKKPTTAWSPESAEIFAGESPQTPESAAEDAQWAAEEVTAPAGSGEAGQEEAFFAETEPEEIDLAEEAPRKSWLWLWLVLLLVLLLLAGGVVVAWYLGWLDPVLKLVGLASDAPSTPTPVASVSPQTQSNPPQSTFALATGATNAKPLPLTKPGAIPPGKPKPASIQEFVAELEEVFQSAPARPVAGMQCWRYVPADANLVVCFNLAELTQQAKIQEWIRQLEAQNPAGQLTRTLSASATEVAEFLVSFRLDWSKLPASLSEKEVLGTMVMVVRCHRPPDREKFLQGYKQALADYREEKIGDQVVFFGTRSEGVPMFLTWLTPETLVLGAAEAVKSVPSLGSPAPEAAPKQWEQLLQRVGNAQVAVLLREVDLKPALKDSPLPPEVQQQIGPLLEKIQGGFVKLEMQAQGVSFQAQVLLADTDSANRLANFLQQLYQKEVQPALVQLSAFAPELADQLQKNLRIASEDAGVTEVRLQLGYAPIAKAVDAVLQLLTRQMFAKPVPVKP